MAERFIEFHLEAQEGLNWQQLDEFYQATGLGRDIEGTKEAYPDVELVERWHDDIQEEMADRFERTARDFGIRVVYLIRPKNDGSIPNHLKKAA